MIKCELCNQQFSALKALSKHLNFIHHMDKKEYYDMYLIKLNDGYCKTCGKPTKFLGLHGYVKHCSNSCAQKDEETLKKIHTFEHNQKVKLGVQNATINRKLAAQKTKETSLSRYGVSNPAKSNIVKQKMKDTIIKQKQQFCLDNDCTPRQDVIKLYGQGWLSLNIPIIKYRGIGYVKNSDVVKIQHLSDYRSLPEKQIFNFLDSIYDGSILRNTRPFGTFELDFYLPDLNLAIEYNGNYFHCVGNEIGVQNEYYHYDKSKECWLHGIRLIHIFEFEPFFAELMLLKSLIYYGIDRYNLNNPNKYWNYDNHKPQIIYYYNNIYPIYSA